MLEPVKVTLEKGDKHFWCCTPGRGLCDERCVQCVEFEDFVATRTGEAYICSCKQTKTPPYCDGSHKQLSDVPG